MNGLSRYEGFVKVCRVCQGINGLSRYQEFVKVSRVCQSKNSLSRYGGFVKKSRVCQGIKGVDLCTRYFSFILAVKLVCLFLQLAS